MSQHDYDLANQTRTAFRADLNNALAAIVSQNSGATEPATMFAYMWWADTATGLLKQRNAANSAWITIGTLASANLGHALLAGSTFTGPVNEARGSVAMHATTMDLWAQPNVIDGTGSSVTITAIANAPQAGARRTLYPITGTTITDGATFAVEGAANYTTAAGDALEFEAITTSTYKVWVKKKDGTAVVVDTTYGINLATKQATTSGTSIDFTGIPAGTKRITMMLSDVSISGTSNLMIQIGDSGGVETSGYSGAAWNSSGSTIVSNSAGFISTTNTAAASAYQVMATLTMMDSATNMWSCELVYSNSANNNQSGNAVGVKSLTAELTQIRLTTVGGSDTFDAGSANIAYES